MSQHRFVIESIPEKCMGCRKCEVACIAAHHDLSFKEALKKRNELASRVRVVSTSGVKAPISCRQCERAPCAIICPTGAMRQVNGLVVVHLEYCAGCRLCILACPFGAITLESLGLPEHKPEATAQTAHHAVAVRCDLCEDWREKEGKTVPACVEICPVKARALVDLTALRETQRKNRLAGSGNLQRL